MILHYILVTTEKWAPPLREWPQRMVVKENPPSEENFAQCTLLLIFLVGKYGQWYGSILFYGQWPTLTRWSWTWKVQNWKIVYKDIWRRDKWIELSKLAQNRRRFVSHVNALQRATTTEETFNNQWHKMILYVDVSLFIQAHLSLTNMLMIKMATAAGIKTKCSLRLLTIASTEWPTCPKQRLILIPSNGAIHWKDQPDAWWQWFVLAETNIYSGHRSAFSAVLLLKLLLDLQNASFTVRLFQTDIAFNQGIIS